GGDAGGGRGSRRSRASPGGEPGRGHAVLVGCLHPPQLRRGRTVTGDEEPQALPGCTSSAGRAASAGTAMAGSSAIGSRSCLIESDPRTSLGTVAPQVRPLVARWPPPAGGRCPFAGERSGGGGGWVPLCGKGRAHAPRGPASVRPPPAAPGLRRRRRGPPCPAQAAPLRRPPL